jgi:hypothetical protein
MNGLQQWTSKTRVYSLLGVHIRMFTTWQLWVASYRCSIIIHCWLTIEQILYEIPHSNGTRNTRQCLHDENLKCLIKLWEDAILRSLIWKASHKDYSQIPTWCSLATVTVYGSQPARLPGHQYLSQLPLRGGQTAEVTINVFISLTINLNQQCPNLTELAHMGYRMQYNTDFIPVQMKNRVSAKLKKEGQLFLAYKSFLSNALHEWLL